MEERRKVGREGRKKIIYRDTTKEFIKERACRFMVKFNFLHKFQSYSRLRGQRNSSPGQNTT